MIYLLHTQARRNCIQSAGSVLSTVKSVLSYMTQLNIDLPILLDAVSWGDPECTQDAQVRTTCTTLMCSKELPTIVRRWWKAPCSSRSCKSRPRAARCVMEEFAGECMREVVNGEMDTLKSVTRLSGEDMTEEALTSLSLEEVIEEMKSRVPYLWNLMRAAACNERQSRRNTMKDPNNVSKHSQTDQKVTYSIAKVIAVSVMTLSYHRSHHNNRFAKMFSIYLKFRGLSARGFDALHSLGLTMSHRWTCYAVEIMSKNAMKEVISLMEHYPWLISHDNVNIPFKVFLRRLDNKGEFGSGSTATVYIKHDAPLLLPSTNQSLKTWRERGIKSPLQPLDIMDLSIKSYPKIQQQGTYHVLCVLLDSPEFNFSLYSEKDTLTLTQPPPIKGLPSGSAHVTLQYMLGTVNISEASYDGNDKLLAEWFSQLRLNGIKSQKRIGLEKIITWVGDQLTVEQLRGLYKFHGEDDNSFERMDWIVLAFGWLHLQMAYANSLHKQYLGTSKGRGLSHAFDKLERKGLGKVATKGLFHHDLEGALYHTAEAHFRACWLQVGGVADLRELRGKFLAELRGLATKIVEEFASTVAMNKMDTVPEEGHDAVKRQFTMWNRDVLGYIVLDQAIKRGDIGTMEAMLPHLLFRFVGGKNSKYAIEVLELLQGLEREWPPDVRDFVREHCWLVNMTGKPLDFLPIDKAQEHNIKDIKVTYCSEGPNIKWEYLKKMHPVVRVIRSVMLHVDNQFETWKRGKKHTVPKKDKDVAELQALISEVHIFEKGRRIASKKDWAKDFVTEGLLKLTTKPTTIERWAARRDFERSKREDYTPFLSDNESVYSSDSDGDEDNNGDGES
ncbi:hypothetical protein JAAARDRAFT_132254 [Jaapia argillacea MUCL 33604]|uniref:DUF6589 domain-containing protein n=1 Tax=Jaapia argillacea MUCL 33604 TaxID=933084 RepID=A0A067PPS1_9AGAM|nr:hypothetical protein JAAARDRAFT_132254 [Jaapia argillacea MUCL 33604]